MTKFCASDYYFYRLKIFTDPFFLPTFLSIRYRENLEFNSTFSPINNFRICWYLKFSKSGFLLKFDRKKNHEYEIMV